jgi:hypothetical protein
MPQLQPETSVMVDAYQHVKTHCLVNGHVDLCNLVLKIEWRLYMPAGTLSRSNVEIVRDLELCALHSKYHGSETGLSQQRALERAADNLLIGRE